MRQSWLKRVGLAMAGLILRVFGMRLKADSSMPADEYGAHGAYRTPDSPVPEASPREPRLSLLSRLSRLIPSFVRSREFWLTIAATTAAAMVVASIWGLWYLFTQSVPDITGYQLTPTIDEVPGAEIPGWVVSLPFAISRWWDVVYAALWTLTLCLLVLSYKNGNVDSDKEGGSISISLIASVAIGLIVAVCVGCEAKPGGHSIGTWQGVFAAALIVPAVAAFAVSIGTTVSIGLSAGLRTCWLVCLVAGFIAAIVFGPPGGVLCCFVVGAFVTIFNLLISSFIALGSD